MQYKDDYNEIYMSMCDKETSSNEKEELYMFMTPTKTNKDDVCIIFADDGEYIEKFMKKFLTSEKLNFAVKSHKLLQNEEHNIESATLGIIFLTPEMLDEFENRTFSYFENLIKAFERSILLCHDAFVNSNDSQFKRKLGSLYHDLEMVHIEKSNTTIDIKKALLRIDELIEKPDAAPVLVTFKLYPEKIKTPYEDVYIVFKNNDVQRNVCARITGSCSGKIQFDCTHLHTSVYMFKPEGAVPGEHLVEVLSNSRSSGVSSLTICEQSVVLSSLISDIVSPSEVLYRSLQCHSVQCFDKELTKIISDSEKPTPRRIIDGIKEKQLQINQDYDYEFPTLIHFCAKFGLKLLCEEFLKFPECNRTDLEIRNKDNKTSSQIALSSGFIDLAADIQPPSVLGPIDEVQQERSTETNQPPPLPPRPCSPSSLECNSGRSSLTSASADSVCDFEVPERRSRGYEYGSTEWTKRMTILSNTDLDIPDEIVTKL